MDRYINQWARESVVEQYGLEVSVRNLSRTRTKQEEYLFDAQQQLQKAKVDEEVAKIEARKEQIQKQLKMSSRRNQSQFDELNKLYDRRAKIITDSDADSDELEHLNQQINRLEQEVSNSSLDEANNNLNLLNPKRNTSKSTLGFEEQMSLPSTPNNLGSNSISDTNIPDRGNEDHASNL
jgi:chromosome segregation ATPase